MQKQKRGKPQPLKKTPFPFRRRDADRIQVVTLNELARLLVRLDHVASVGVNAHHRIMWAAAMFGVAAFGGIGGGFGGKGSGGGFGLGGVGVAGFGLLGIATAVFLFNIQSQQAGNV
jgi:hypothetical protein